MNVSASSEQGMTLHNESSSKKLRCAGFNFLTPRLLVAVTMGRKTENSCIGLAVPSFGATAQFLVLMLLQSASQGRLPDRHIISASSACKVSA